MGKVNFTKVLRVNANSEFLQIIGTGEIFPLMVNVPVTDFFPIRKVFDFVSSDLFKQYIAIFFKDNGYRLDDTCTAFANNPYEKCEVAKATDLEVKSLDKLLLVVEDVTRDLQDEGYHTKETVLAMIPIYLGQRMFENHEIQAVTLS